MKRITVPIETEIADALAIRAKQNKRGQGTEAAVILENYFTGQRKTRAHKKEAAPA